MTIYYAHRLTDRQAHIRDFVRGRGTTLRERLHELGRRAALEDFDDLAAVRTWLFDMHHTEARPPVRAASGGDR